jgi:hypothetical protein
MNFMVRFLRIAAFVVIAGFIGGAVTAGATSIDRTTNVPEFSQPAAETAPLFPFGDATPQPAILVVLSSSDVDDDQLASRIQVLAAPAWPRRAGKPVKRNDPAAKTRSFLRPQPTAPPGA